MVARHEPRQLRHEHHKVPITALTYYSHQLLLAGEGTHLVAYSIDRKTQVQSIQVFRSQAIHKVLVDKTTGVVLVYGGSHIAFLKSHENGKGNVNFAIVAQKDTGDWIFDAAFTPDSGHQASTQIVLITAHNALVECTLIPCSETTDTATISTETIVPGSNCILYCAHISWLSDSSCLIASGTAFGDIILWSSQFGALTGQEARTKTHYIFQAHEGSIFGVQVSPHLSKETLGGPCRVLVSCSDDRTVRLWDISDLDRESPSLIDIQRETGFGSTNQSDAYAPPLLAKAMGHISRIWSVHFIRKEASADQCSPELSPLAVASFGEDGSRITWKVDISTNGTGEPTYHLRQSHVHPLHTGKNIWSATIDEGRCATGGADGTIALLPSYENGPETLEIKDSLLSLPSDETGGSPKDSYKSYDFVSLDTIVATTAQGRIVALRIGQDGAAPSVESYGSHQSLKSVSMVTAAPGIAFIAGIGGSVLMYSLRLRQCFPLATMSGKVAGMFVSEEVETSDHLVAEEPFLLVSTVASNTAQLLKVQTSTDSDGSVGFISIQHLVKLEQGFIVTSFALISFGSIRYAAIGSRRGVLAIYQLPETEDSQALSPIMSLRYCHSKESITALRWRIDKRDNGSSGYLFSTGRDGTHAVHRVTRRASDLSFELVHQLELPFGPNIEGIAFTADSHLLVWGFGGKNFIVHDAIAQQDVFTVQCGGGVNRNWVYQLSAKGGSFAWTQSSTLMRTTQCELPHHSIHPGGHGREIKAVAVSAGERQVIATGAEDTDIKLFEYSSSGGFTCLQTLRKHNTGIQHLEWSTDGRYLFSSGGSEEFYVWFVCHDVPLLSIGVVCESAHPRSRASDLRIMGFDVSERVDGQEREASFDITMVYSDSSIKCWSYTSDTWALQASGDYLTACLTGVHRLPPSTGAAKDSQLVTTATDGYIALWQPSADSLLTWQTRRPIHQNSILASTTHPLPDNSILLITASDDNALALSRLNLNKTNNTTSISTLLIPRAHAAAVTALAVHQTSADRFRVLSASIDQRVKVWEVCVDVAVTGTESVRVRKVQNVFTSVADVSGLELLELEGGRVGVLVCGVGMDVWGSVDGVDRGRGEGVLGTM